jgi:hypothetical protein
MNNLNLKNFIVDAITQRKAGCRTKHNKINLIKHINTNDYDF